MCFPDRVRIAAFVFVAVAASGLLFWMAAHLSGGCELKTIAAVIKIGC